MRITNRMMTNSYLTSLNKALERQNKLQEQMSDGKAIHRPSDDPIKTIRSLRFNTNLKMNEQYTQNAKDARSWMESTDGVVSDVSSVLIRVKELTIKAGGANEETSYKAIAGEIDGIINHLVQIGNSKIGDRSLFAGQMDKTEPLERITDPVYGDMVVYRGDNNRISMPVQPGSLNSDLDSVNLTAPEIFGPVVDKGGNQTLDLFNHLIALKEELEKPTPDTARISGELMAFNETDHSRVLEAQTRLGERMTQYEMTQNMLEKSYVTITGDVAANEDIDLARALIDFNTSENVYRAALALGARILPASLVDFLK